MVSRIDESTRASVTRLLISFVEQNSRLFADEVLELAAATPSTGSARYRYRPDVAPLLRYPGA